MRQKQYLNNPTEKEMLTNINGEELNPNLKDIVNISKNQKIQDVLNVIRFEDFEKGYSNEAHIKVLKDETKDKLSMDYETQIRILIESENNLDQRENLREYYKDAQKKNDFDEERFVEDLLSNNYVFL